MRAALAPGKPDNIHVYPAAQHGFNADYRPATIPSPPAMPGKDARLLSRSRRLASSLTDCLLSERAR